MPTVEVTDQLDSIKELQDLVGELVQKTGNRAKRSYLSALYYREDHKEEIQYLDQRLSYVLERLGVEAHMVALGDIKHMKNKQMKSEQRTLLKELRPVNDACYDSQHAPRGCTKNTRVEIIDLIERWAKERSLTPRSIFWLSGLAGTGKTAIMKTLSERFAELGVLGACFFASVNTADRRNPQNIVRSLAYQLAYYHPALCEHICSAIRDQPAVVDKSVELQVQALLSTPIAQAKSQITHPIVIMIDALDECDKIDGFEGGRLLPGLLDLASQYPEKLRLLITSRITSSISSMFEAVAAENLKLHDVEQTKVAEDIRQYLKVELGRISSSRSIKSLWYTDDDVDKLVERAGNLFIYAATVISWLDDPHFLPKTRLQEVLRLKEANNPISPHETLDRLYEGILQNALGPNTRDRDKVLGRIRSLLEMLVVLFEPLTISDLATLLSIDKDLVQLDLKHLLAVVVFEQQDSAGAVSIYHASFIDYVTDASRCSGSFYISKQEAHGKMGMRCINIAHNTTSGAETLSSSKNRIEQYLLWYAQNRCCDHLERSHAESGYIMKGIEQLQIMCSQNSSESLDLLDELSWLLYLQLQQIDDMDLLREKVSIGRKQMEMSPPGHPSRHYSLKNLDVSLNMMYSRTGDEQLLKESIQLAREALELTPHGHSDRDRSLIHLANRLESLYGSTGDDKMLKECIQLGQEALELHPPGHPYRHHSLYNLALYRFSLYERTGNQKVLEECIQLTQEGLELRPPGHPNRHYSLGNLALHRFSLYERTGNQEVLEECIQLEQATLELRPPGHPDRHFSLCNLALYRFSLYERTGNQQVLGECIQLAQEALGLRPSGHPERYLSFYSVAIILHSLHKHTGDQKQLHESTQMVRDGLELCPRGHHYHGRLLHQLALCLWSLYQVNKVIQPLTEAVQVAREALATCPVLHPHHPVRVRTLADYLEGYERAAADRAAADEAAVLEAKETSEKSVTSP